MVKIIDYKTRERENGEQFFVLVVQGGVEAVKSEQTGRTYLTTKKAGVSCTFDEETCKSLIGISISGSIKRVEVEPYEYTNSTTGETIESTHRYEYVTDEDAIVEANVLENEEVL